MSQTSRRFSLGSSLFNRLERGGASDRFTLKLLFFAIIAIAVVLVIAISNHYAAIVPIEGGTLSEGVVGTPRFVNPALAITRADQDMVALVYRGLLRLGPDNTLLPDIAESVTLAEDGRTYNISLRKDVVFHDNAPLTANDVAFTIGLIQNQDLKSPLRGNWNDVTVTVQNEYELSITLEETYTPFIENFTLGIMPRHIWLNLPIEQIPFSLYNTEPIGAGPFMVDKVERDDAGLINSYHLTSFQNAATAPNLSSIALHFYQNEEQLLQALTSKAISTTVYLPTKEVAKLDPDDYQIIKVPLPRVFGIFFNQNKSSILRDKSVRQALEKSIDRDALIDNVLFGFGIPTTLPTLPGSNMLQSAEASLVSSTSASLLEAQEILRRGGWTQNSAGLWEKRIDGTPTILAITLRTSNNPMFSDIVTSVGRQWEDLGVEVNIEQYEQAGLVQSVIRPRDFEALLFGMDMNRTEDLYPFWHSSQKDDPGLNIAQYTNISVDRALEETRTTTDEVVRTSKLAEAATLISSETPAIFLFAPTMAYVIDTDIKTTQLPSINRPSDRFMNITNWYAKTDSLWPYFRKNSNEQASL